MKIQKKNHNSQLENFTKIKNPKKYKIKFLGNFKNLKLEN